MKESTYIQETHRIGRWGTLISLLIMIGIPLVICSVYDVWPSGSQLLATMPGIIAIFGPSGISQTFCYTPILGSSAYIAFVTGNINNLKVPCVVNAMDVSDTPAGTEEGDVVSAIAVCVSAIVTMVVIIIGVILLIPLQPILSAPVVKTATANILPALFGGMLLTMTLNNRSGKFVIKGQAAMVGIGALIMFIVHFTLVKIPGNEGYLMLAAIPMLMGISLLMRKFGLLKVVPFGKPQDAK